MKEIKRACLFSAYIKGKQIETGCNQKLKKLAMIEHINT